MAVVGATALLAGACGAGRGGTATSPAALVTIGSGLRGPAGLSASVYARGLVHASAFAIDPHGRLWVATADYTDSGKDAVYVVTQPGGAPQAVITGVHTPLGLLWYHDELYVTSTGRVDAYRGFDGARFAGQRTVVTVPAGVGESNGIAAAPDGRLVMGISAPCDHCKPASSLSGSIVSFRPDGTDLRVDVARVRAPIGLAYYPGTSDLFATMNQRDDLGAKTPADTLSLVRAGEAWGFPDCYGQGGTSCAGVPRATASLDPHAAVSGLVIVTGHLGSTRGTAALVAEWKLGRVQRVALTRRGSTYAASVQTFLTGLQNPVPLVQAPTGLLVGDWTTGIVYRVAAA